MLENSLTITTYLITSTYRYILNKNEDMTTQKLAHKCSQHYLFTIPKNGNKPSPSIDKWVNNKRHPYNGALFSHKRNPHIIAWIKF